MHNLITLTNYQTRLRCTPLASQPALRRAAQAIRKARRRAAALSAFRQRSAAGKSGQRRFRLRRRNSPRAARAIPRDVRCATSICTRASSNIPAVISSIPRRSTTCPSRPRVCLSSVVGSFDRSRTEPRVREADWGGSASDPGNSAGHEARTARRVETSTSNRNATIMKRISSEKHSRLDGRNRWTSAQPPLGRIRPLQSTGAGTPLSPSTAPSFRSGSIFRATEPRSKARCTTATTRSSPPKRRSRTARWC